MFSIHTLLVCLLVLVGFFAPAHVLDFCPRAEDDCQREAKVVVHTQVEPSCDEQSVSHLIHDITQMNVSSKNIMDKLPVDEVNGNFVRTVRNCIFSKSTPTPLRGPLRLAALSKDVVEGILNVALSAAQTDEFLQYASGGRVLPGSVPLAHRYGGHQFGYWAGQLGDGRAHLLGQYIDRNREIWELQLKGSGKTPYSRSGDGRAVIRSSVREFLCSEAMHFLRVPTSRAASLIVSDEPVLRDQFYNGNVKTERGAVVLRVAKSWLRIGSLEILSQSKEIDLLRKLLDFVIDEHFPSISSHHPDKYLLFYSTVVNETAHLIAQWLSVGFAHGVCNTDNFSLLSITIDYGPFGFMESYNPDFVPNTSDDEGRYRIGAQASVGQYNLQKLLTALSPVLSEKQLKRANTVLEGYVEIYQIRIQQLFRAKLGLLGDEEDDGNLIAMLLKMMEETNSDFTMTFRQLSELSAQQLQNKSFDQAWALEELSSHKLFSDWLGTFLRRHERQHQDCDFSRQQRMKRINPRYVLRNWMAESAIRKAETNNFSEVVLLHQVLSSPFVTQETAEAAGYAARPPTWAGSLKVSCSS